MNILFCVVRSEFLCVKTLKTFNSCSNIYFINEKKRNW